MKRIVISVLAGFLAIGAFAKPGQILGKNAGEWTVCYKESFDRELDSTFALAVSQALGRAVGSEINVAPMGENVKKNGIRLGVLKDDFKYEIKAGKNSIDIKAGGIWAAEYALKQFCADLIAKGIDSKYVLSGTVDGIHLFPAEEAVNLRILDDNIWQYDSENENKIPDIWCQLDEDPRNSVRSRGYAQMVRAFMPDIITLQEYSKYMHRFLYPLLKGYGYEICIYENENNFTPIFYNTATVKPLETAFHSYRKADYEGLDFEKDTLKSSNFGDYNNHDTKSYTAAVFELKDGKRIAVCSTHLWYKQDRGKGNRGCVGSNDARWAQINLAMDALDSLGAKYSCPQILLGDMNCNEGSRAIKSAFARGWKPCYELATGETEAADSHNGHHKCSPKDGFSRMEHKWRKNTRKEGAIDHILLHDQGPAEVRNFKCLTEEFTVKLTDHYPYVVDLILK